MPHEVIMPALGMAQDTGHLVAWRRQAGDKVSAGDVLMEIETDKSTMEVEAGADGWVTELRASAGDDVPVGRVVAVIGDTAEAASPAPVTSEPPAAAADGVSVIMPALGMAQDTGLIVSWAKAPGDPIAVGEALLEVETDKSTMEIEAQAAGFVAEIRAAAGASVPVGEVIAVISAQKPAAAKGPGEGLGEATAATPKPPAAAKAEPAPASKPEPARAPATPAMPSPVDGRVLASPKARRLAAERGLDLGALFAEGAGRPIHVRDLDALAAKAAERRTTAPASAPAAAHAARLEARAPAAPLAGFTAWLAAEGGGANRSAVLAAFAAAGLRGGHGDAQELVVAVETADGADPVRYADADRARLAALAPSEDASAPSLVVRDLLDTPIVAARAGGLATPVLTLVPAGDEIALSLDYKADRLDDRAAVALVTALAGRLAEPLRHLL